MNFIDAINTKIKSDMPISRADAARLFVEASDSELKHLATSMRTTFHRPFEATYLIMAIVNYTNICVANCDYCSFFRLPHDQEGYLLNFDEVCQKIDNLVTLGGSLIGFNGGFHPKLRIHDYASLFSKIRVRYPELEFYEMTIAEFMFSCKVSKISYDEGAAILKESGTRWITGGGAEILDDSFRMRHSPGKFKVDDYYNAQEAVLKQGLGSTATMVIGFDETLDERLNHLESLRNFQNRVNGGLASFLCWTYKPFHNKLGGQEISTQEYLRWLAVCRIYLNNFVNIRTSVLTKNHEALFGLEYGANDFDLPTEDEVTQKAGAEVSHDFDAILATATKQGFQTIKRKPWPTRISAKNLDPLHSASFDQEKTDGRQFRNVQSNSSI